MNGALNGFGGNVNKMGKGCIEWDLNSSQLNGLPPWSSESTAALEQNVSNFNVSFAHFCPLWCKLIILFIG